MGKKWEVELNDKGIQELLKSDEIENELLNQARRVASSSDGNYRVDSLTAQTRKVAIVAPDDKDTRRKVYKDNALTKGVQAVRE